jgi:uncharacterized membrane protein YfcA
VTYVLIGLVAGFFSALFGVGGGIVIVPLLVLTVHWDMRYASATSLAAIGITATAGVITYVVHGEVRPLYALLLGIPAAFGAAAGSAVARRLPVQTLSYLFSVLLVGIAVDMLVR